MSRKKEDKITDYETERKIPKKRTELLMGTTYRRSSGAEGTKNMGGN
jgi:hypothetical protein